MENYQVKLIDRKSASDYICKHHYSHGCSSSAKPCYGLFDQDQNLIGVLMFATPCSENVRRSVFGAEHKDRVIELHRLHILDCTPKNTESWFISRCLKLLVQDRPQTRGVISFSDSTEGHSGIIYKATNAFRCGTTGSFWFYMDQSGRLRHPRQGGVNIKLEEAQRRGWKRVKRGAKNRYIYVLGTDRKDRAYWLKLFRLKFPDATTTEDLNRK